MATNKMSALDFFADRNNDMALREEADSTNDRFLRMIEASERRASQLAEAGARRQAVLEQNKASVVGKLGLDEDGVTAQAVNLGASALSGLGRVAGHLLSAPSSLAAAAETSNLNKSDWDAYTAYTQGQATPEQMEQLNRNAGSQFTLGNITRALSGNFDNATPLQRIEAADSMRGAARTINNAFDWNSIVHQSRRDDLRTDLGANFEANWNKVKEGGLGDMASGIAGLLVDAGKAAVNNPGAVAEYVAENIPQLGLGFFGTAGRAGLAASNIGYAADNFQKGIEKYQEENNGAYPDIQTREKMAAWATATALAEQVGDLSMLRGIGGAAVDAASAGRRTLLDAAKQGVKAVGTEAATEGFQTFAEGEAGLKPASAFDIYEGAVIGGLSGGVMTGGGAAAAVAAQSTVEASQKAAEQRAEKAAQKEAFDAAVEAGDPTVFTKPGANYAPDEAIRVLQKISTPETQEENFNKAVEIASDADEQLNALQDKIKAASPEEAKALMPQATRLERQVDSALRLLDQFTDTAKAEEVAAATTQEEATKTINLAMSAPDNIDSKTVKALVEDTSNALTPEQRTYLRAMDEARVAENAAKDISKVNTEVLYGSTKNVGIKQYRERANRALVAGNTAAASTVVKALDAFAKVHESKAAAMKQAFDEASATGETISVARNKAGQWEVLPDLLSDAQRKKVGGLNIHPRSNGSGLIDAAQYEAKAARAAVTELQAAVAAVKGAPSATPTQAPAAAPAAPTAVATPTPASAAAPQATAAPAEVNTAVESQPDVMMVQNVDATQAQGASTSSVAPSKKLSKAEAEKVGFKKLNLVDQYFTVKGKNPKQSTDKALVSTPDFLSKLDKGEVKAADFISTGELTENQQVAISDFQAMAKKWKSSVEANYTVGNPDFRYTDPIQFLLTEVGGKVVAPENLTTAIIYAAYSWISEQANMPARSTMKEVKKMFGVKEFAKISRPLYQAVNGKGVLERNVINEMGQRAVSALGLSVDKDAYKNLQSTLQISIGAHALKLLEDQGLVVRSTVTAAQIAEGLPDENADESDDSESNGMKEAAKEASEKTTVGFIQIARTNGKAIQAITDRSKAQKGTQSLLNKVFGSESSYVEPSLTPIENVQKTTKNTNMGVPESLQKVMKYENAVPNYLRQDTWRLVSLMDDESVMEMMGADARERTAIHKSNRDSIEAKNDGLARELSNARDYFSTLPEDAAMYFEHSVWKQQRVGIVTNLINPQTSKLHRFMMFRPEWETKVSIADAAMMENFRLRVAEGLGVKTDKQDNTKSLADYAKKIKEPAVIRAVYALRKTVIQGGDMTPEFQQAIVAGVKKGGEDMHSLDALIALANYQEAVATKQTKFTTHMMGEVDGVTNGPMLSHLMMGAGVSSDDLFDMLNRGGMYSTDSQYQNYNLWRAAEGHQDLYETTIGNVMGRVQSLMHMESLKAVMDNIYTITGELLDENGKVAKAGRNIIKTPLTAMVFGSSTNGAIDSMFDKFIDTIYEQIEKLETPEQKQVLLDSINGLIEFGKGKPLNKNLTIAQLLETELTTEQESAIKHAFNITLGDAVKETMSTDFAVFMERRKVYNTAAQAAFQLYNSALLGLTEQFMEEQMDAGLIKFRVEKGEKIPLHDLTSAQEAQLNERLKPLRPILQTMFTIESGGNPDSGLAISKSARKFSTKAQYQATAHFGKPTTTGHKTRKVAAYERILSAPGVAMLPMGAHSTDSWISHTAVMGFGTPTQVLNVHDAHGSGLQYFQRTAQNLNRATFEAMLGYSPAAEMKQSLNEVVINLAQLMKDSDAARAIAPHLKSAFAELDKKMPKDMKGDPLNNIMKDLTDMAFAADSVRLDTLSKMGAVDQYALQGGQYVITDADRAKASKKLSLLKPDLVPFVKEQAKALTEFAKGVKKAKPAEVDAEFQAEEVPNPVKALAKTVSPVINAVINDTAMPVEASLEGRTPMEKAKVVQATSEAAKALKTAFSPWGEIGTSTSVQDDNLVAAFEANPEMNKAQVMEALRTSLVAQQAPKNVKEFNAKLFAVLAKLVPSDVKVKYVSPDTAPTEIMEKGASKARGWYVAQNGKAEIYILSKEHLHSAVAPEVLLHELTHSVLAGIVENVESQPKEVQELVEDLNKLMAKAKALVEKEGLTQFNAAVSNIHEFIAYGMTNLDFQRQVVSKTSMQSKTKKNELVQGMKAFIQNIVGILFRGSDRSTQAITVNGMTILIGNVSGLFNAVSKNPSKANVLLNAQSMDPLDVANNLGTVAIFEAIKSNNPDNQNSTGFEDHMSNLLTNVVSKLHGAFGTLKATAMANQAMTPVDVYSKAINAGVMPFASKAIAAGFKVNDQEAFVMDQVKATVQATLDRNEAQVSLAHKELRKVFAEARQKVKAMDLLPQGVTEATASQADKDAAQALWDFAFKAETRADGTSDYISGFVAATLGHEQFATALQFNTDPVATNDGTLWGRVVEAFNKVMDFVGGLLLKTKAGDRADRKILSLVDTLVDIEAKRRVQVAQNKSNMMDKFEEATRGLSEKGKKAVSDFGDSKFFKNSKNGYIKFTGTALNLVAAPERVEALMAKMQEMRDKSFKDRQGIIASLVSEMQGITDDKAVIGKLLRGTKNIERARKEVITNTANFVLQSFGDTELSPSQNKAVTNTFLRTDLSALVDDYSLVDMDKLLMDQKFRRDEIDRLSDGLASDPNVKFYANGIKGLAYYMATGLVRVPHLLMNAHNIARLGGYNTTAVSEEHAATVEPLIDKLISLHALDYLSQAERAEASQVLRQQNNRTDGGNGIEMILKLHKQMQADSKAHLFEGNDALFMKGYTSEIYNPYVDIVVADDAEGHELMMAGYTKGSELSQDDLDSSAPKSMYVVRDGGLASHLTGTLSLTDMKSRGSTVRADTYAQNQRLKNLKNQEMAVMNQVFIEPDQVKKNYMAPVLNNAGEVADYRYMMSKATKDTVLERDNRLDKILGAYAGSVLDKQVSPVQNKAVVQALFDQYEADKIDQGDRYLEISEKSSDPVLREHWKLLPAATKKAVKEIWGSEKMYVRPDMIDINFGYRKYTLANIFKKDADERNAMEKVFASAMESIVRGVGATKGLRGADLDAYVGRTGLYTRRAEDMWQEIVKEAKDIIVVRSGIVLLGNISSNLTELAWMGVPMKDIVRHHQVALRAASDYQRDSARLSQVETMLSSGYIEGSVGELEQEAVRLRDAINRSPVKELIDAGLMPTIVEDLGQDDDIYSYKSRFARNTEFLTDKLNDKVKAAAKVAYISHDTALYKSLNRATQLSDFVARYTLYHHVTTRTVNPLSKEDAVRYASDAFVNYDIPTHRSMQYLNDMGIVMFTKYYIRIQKVLMRMFRENPARAMMMMAFSHFFSQVPTVLDGSMLNKLSYNPFSAGAFKYPAVLDDLATVKVGMSPFN